MTSKNWPGQAKRERCFPKGQARTHVFFSSADKGFRNGQKAEIYLLPAELDAYRGTYHK